MLSIEWIENHIITINEVEEDYDEAHFIEVYERECLQNLNLKIKQKQGE